MIILYILLLTLLFYYIFFIAQFYNIIFYGYPPFISSSLDSVEKIIELVKIKEGETIYELGCGRARFLKSIEDLKLQNKLIGVESLFSIYLINKIRLKAQGSRIKLLHKDFFKLNLSEADIIYCYLNNTTMLKLGEKIIRECRPGTKIISQTFSLSQLKPVNMVVVNDKKVYFYIV